MMKKFAIVMCALTALAGFAFGGTETYSSGREMKQTAVQQTPCPEWYRDTEWNVNLWGTYALTGNSWRNDTYLGVDHAWGGGIDAKYFFHRYFGVGLEGYAVSLNQNHGVFFDVNGNRSESGAAGAALGTFTFRYPIPCTRFAPYVFAGGGAIFGGGGREELIFASDGDVIEARNRGSETKAVGQFGGGFEVRFTPTIGLMNDFSWNVVAGPKNNFGMVRSGITIAF
jgi:hypothetical protein